MPLLNESNQAAARDSLGGLTKVCSSIVALRSLSGPDLVGTVQVMYGSTLGDGLGRLYIWNAADSTADNGGTVIAPYNGSGRWNALTLQAPGIEQICGQLEAPTAKTYTLILSSKIAYTLNEVTIVTAGGTVTADFQINGVDITSLSALAVTSTPQTVAATGANTIPLAGKLTMILTGIVSTTDLQFTIKLTK